MSHVERVIESGPDFIFYVLQVDIHNSSQFIAALGSALVTLSSDWSWSTVAGEHNQEDYANGTFSEARFSKVKGILQDNGSSLVSDSGNRCIRLMNYTQGTVSHYAGVCKGSGGGDGNFGEARFTSLSTIIR